MGRLRFSRIVSVVLLLSLSACASAPDNINDVCAVFDQKDGWLSSWQDAAERTERKYGIPVPVLMATLRKESAFDGHARPPRTTVLGFIPWSRPSSAYGYSQALDGTWEQYRLETGNFGASRSDFEDAIDFVGWYHSKTVQKYGVAPNDAYNLYLAYYLGWAAYGRGDWQGNGGLLGYAKSTQDMSDRYAMQLQGC
jgi:hypothetical protein